MIDTSLYTTPAYPIQAALITRGRFNVPLPAPDVVLYICKNDVHL